MLARLATIPGLQEAQVDHRGELVRLVVAAPGVLDAVRGELAGLGYEGLPVSGLGASDVRWHAFDDVRDLSREEAEIVARRVTAAFVRAHASNEADAIRLENVVTSALYECFIANDLDAQAPAGALRTGCTDAVARAARDLIGPEAALDLGRLLTADLEAGDRDERS